MRESGGIANTGGGPDFPSGFTRVSTAGGEPRGRRSSLRAVSHAPVCRSFAFTRGLGVCAVDSSASQGVSVFLFPKALSCRCSMDPS